MTTFLPIARLALVAFALLSVSAGAGIAKIVTVVPGQVVGQAQVPDNWTVTTTDRGIELASPGEEVMMWMEVFAPAEVDAVKREHAAYFQGQGVRITGPAAERRTVTNGLVTIVQEIPATYNGAPTILAYQVYGAEDAPTQLMLITYWASPEGDKTFGPQVQSILTGTRFTLR